MSHHAQHFVQCSSDIEFDCAKERYVAEAECSRRRGREGAHQVRRRRKEHADQRVRVQRVALQHRGDEFNNGFMDFTAVVARHARRSPNCTDRHDYIPTVR